MSRLAAATLLSLLATGCAPSGADDDLAGLDDGKADGRSGPSSLFVQGNDPFYWADSDYASFDAVAASIGFAPHAAPLAAEDALTLRLQGHLDRIDALVRAHVQRELRAPLVAPRPVLKILPSSNTFNAWVSGTLACTGARMDGSAAQATDAVGLVRKDAAWRNTGFGCVRPEWPGKDALRTFWNRARPSCELDAGGAVGGAKCTVVGEGDSELSVLATSPFIQMSSDLIASLDEAAVIVVLAHELGHYYRAHVSDAQVQRYHFWYETEADRKKLPVPSANAQQLQALYAELTSGPRPLQSLRPGRYSPRLREYVLRYIAPLLQERTEPGFVCAQARDAIGPWASALDHDSGLPGEAIDAYLGFEAALAACAPRLALGADPGARELSYGRVVVTVPAAKLKSITLPLFGATLAHVLDALDARARKLDEKAARLQRSLRDNRIGLYTTEQEADNLALRIVVEMGMSPTQVRTSWLEFMSAIEAILPPEYLETYKQQEGGYDRASCQALYERGFTATDAQGRTEQVLVPLGQLDEPHHSSCYRLFNFWREARLQRYAEPQAPMSFAPGWPALREAARTMSLGAQASGL